MIKNKIRQWEKQSLKSLIGIALQNLEPYRDDDYVASTCLMRRSANPQIVAMMQKLFQSKSWRKRVVAVDVMSQLCAPVRPFLPYAVKETQRILEVAITDQNSTVVVSALYGISFRKTEKALPNIVALAEHKDDYIRRAVVSALYQFSDDLSINTLLKLAQDINNDVREYATFALGRMHADIDTPEIRSQLIFNCDDRCHYVADDALTGLIYRRDSRVCALLQKRLMREDELNNCIKDAIEEVGDLTLANMLGLQIDR